MKPPKLQRKVEDLRVTRKTNAHFQAGGGEGWAISYADMLMVLLSFFVMFFSLKEESPQTFDDQLKSISMSMKKNQDRPGNDHDSRGSVMGFERNPSTTLMPKTIGEPMTGKSFSAISEALVIDGVTVTNEKDHLVLTLDDTAFKSAAFEPDEKILSKIDMILQRLEPFNKSVQMTIVGHTDARKLVWRNKFLEDNFDLSSLRALKVLKHVIAKGFPENRATARAASSFDRVTRSVSIVIQPIDVPTTESGS